MEGFEGPRSGTAEELIESMAEALRSAARRVLSSRVPGLALVLESYFKLRLNEDFYELLVRRPRDAFKGLVDYLGSELEAELLLSRILAPIIGEENVGEAIERIKRGDSRELVRLLARGLRVG